jgi:serine/threonine protein kinase
MEAKILSFPISFPTISIIAPQFFNPSVPMDTPKDRYETVQPLGEGGYGRALLVKNRETGELHVMKEVRIASLKQKERDEALREADVLASMAHTNIIRYIDSFQERGCFYIVMEYADGGDLEKKIEARGRIPFPEKEILHDFIQICLAIKYCHDRKILHRDLKAENVFLMKDGTVKLGDFGIARVLEHTLQLCRTQVGTPYYLSPEICEGKNYNSKTDIWSLGCILYQLCALKYPFSASNLNALLTVIMRGKYQALSAAYSSELRNLVGRMLTKDPSRRPSVNQILGMPFIKQRLSSFLDETILAYEMSHTILHGRKPLGPPTMVLGAGKPPTPGAPSPTKRQPTTTTKRSPPTPPDSPPLQKKNAEDDRKRTADQKRATSTPPDSPQTQNRAAEDERKRLADQKRAPSTPPSSPPLQKRTVEDEQKGLLDQKRGPSTPPNSPPLQRRSTEDERKRLADQKRQQVKEEDERRRAALEAEKRRESELSVGEARRPSTSGDEYDEDILSVLPGRRQLLLAAAGAEVLDLRAKAVVKPSVNPPPEPFPDGETGVRPTRRLLSPERIRTLSSRGEGKRGPVKCDLAGSLREALSLPQCGDEEEDEDVGFEVEGQPAVFFIGDKEVTFPVGNDAQTRAARATAMREFLAREIGQDLLARVMTELADHELRYDARLETCETLDAGYVVIARQLYVLEFDQ